MTAYRIRNWLINRKLFVSFLVINLAVVFLLIGCALSSESRIDKAADKVAKIIVRFDKIVGRVEIGGYSEMDYQNDVDTVLEKIDMITSKTENYIDGLPPETQEKMRQYYMRKFDETYSRLSKDYFRTLEALNIE